MTIGAKELAKVLGIARSRVYQLENEGKITREKDGNFNVAAVRLALRNNLSQRQKSRARGDIRPPIEYTEDAGVGAQAPTLANVQLQHEIAKAATAQLQLKRLKGSYVLAEDVKRAWGEHISAVRSRVLLVPGKLAPRVAVETDVLACQEILERDE